MKNLLFIGLFCLSATVALSQITLSAGPAAGVNYSWISDIEGDYERTLGLNAGAQLTYSNIQNWGIGLGVFYSQEGVQFENGNQEYETELNYIRVPLKGFIFFRQNDDTFRPKIFLGPSFAFLVDGDVETPSDGTVVKLDSKDYYKTFDLGLLGGLGINIRLAETMWFNFDAGYTYGLLNIAEAGGDHSNRGIHGTVGLAFGL
jgi:hypothetical protein